AKRGAAKDPFRGGALLRRPALARLERHDSLRLPRDDRVRRTVRHEVAVGRRPIDRLRARIRLPLRVQSHEVRRERYAESAADTLLAIHLEHEPPSRI